MKKIITLLYSFLTIILISCQNKNIDFSFVPTLELPYVFEIEDYDEFVINSLNDSINKVEYLQYFSFNPKFNISKIKFIGKYTLNKSLYLLFQDVSYNNDFFPSIYITRIGGDNNNKMIDLTSKLEETYVDKITIDSEGEILLRKNYWDERLKQRKNDSVIIYSNELIQKKENKLISNDLIGIQGHWRTYCESPFSFYPKKENKVFIFEVMSNQIYIQAKLEKKSEREYSMFLIKPDDLGRGGMGLSWGYLSKNKPIANIKLLDNNTIEFLWIGFYNEKSKEIEFDDCEFVIEQKMNPVILKRCKN